MNFMRFFRLKRPRAKAHRSNLYPVYAAIALFAVLAIALGVVSGLMVSRAKRLETGYNALINHIQTDLNMALRKFDDASLPKADLAGDIVPEMRMYLYSADSFNDVLTQQYGGDASVLDDALYQQITLALNDIERLVRTGQSTDEALLQLGQYMATLQTTLSDKFSFNNLLLPQNAAR
jgi:hypothetical protein